MVVLFDLSSLPYKIFRSGLSILLAEPLCPVPNSTYGAYTQLVNTSASAPSCVISDFVFIELRRFPVSTGAKYLAFFCIRQLSKDFFILFV